MTTVFSHNLSQWRIWLNINATPGITCNIYQLLILTFRRHTQVGHDNQHRICLNPQDVGGHIFIIQRFSCGDYARPVVYLKMPWNQNIIRAEHKMWKKRAEYMEALIYFKPNPPFLTLWCLDQMHGSDKMNKNNSLVFWHLVPSQALLVIKLWERPHCRTWKIRVRKNLIQSYLDKINL